MRKTYIKQTFYSVAVLILALLTCVSCIKDNETETAPESAILSFSVSSITSSVITKKYDSSGNATDTVVSKTINGSDIYFNIDQVNGHISNVDSLPNWVDLTRVVPTFTCYGSVFGKVVAGDETYYMLTSGSDSIDFSKTVELVCISTDGESSKHYTVDIYKHVNATDTLEWKSITSDLSISGQCKLYVADERVYAFAQNAEGEDVVTFAQSSDAAAYRQSVYDATTWSTPVSIPVESGSVVLFDGNFYGRGTDGYLYRAKPEQLAAIWTKVSDQPIERLLAADEYYLYAYDGTAIIGTSDLNTWTVQGTADLDKLPETSVNSFAYTSNTNSTIQVAVMTGLSSNDTLHGVAWYKMTSPDDNINQPWSYIEVTLDNPYGLPHLDHLSVTRYNEALYAIGSKAGAYEYLYRSDDNGITWHPQTEMYPMPADLDAANGAASITTVGNSLWIIQENGKIWQGSIR